MRLRQEPCVEAFIMFNISIIDSCSSHFWVSLQPIWHPSDSLRSLHSTSRESLHINRSDKTHTTLHHLLLNHIFVFWKVFQEIKNWNSSKASGRDKNRLKKNGSYAASFEAPKFINNLHFDLPNLHSSNFSKMLMFSGMHLADLMRSTMSTKLMNCRTTKWLAIYKARLRKNSHA